MSLSPSPTATRERRPLQPKPRRRAPKARPRQPGNRAQQEVFWLNRHKRYLTPAEMADRIRDIQRLAVRHRLGPADWAIVDKLRARLATGVHARSGDFA